MMRGKKGSKRPDHEDANKGERCRLVSPGNGRDSNRATGHQAYLDWLATAAPARTTDKLAT